MPIIVSETSTASVAAGAELVIDPSEVAESRTELDLNAAPITVKVDGIDWGDAEIQTYMAEQARGESPVDIRFPNRTITIPLILNADDSVSYNTARANLQAKVGLLQREGGWLRRGTGLYADIVNATLNIPDSWMQLAKYANVDVVLTLTALPDFYGDELTLSDHSTTTLGELVWTETAIAGDHPGRLRLVVDNDQSTDQRGLVAAVRCRHYSADSTAALVYEAEDLTPLDAAAPAVVAGASGGSAVRHTNLGTGWTPVLSTEIDGVGHMTHTGSYRVRARLSSTGGTNVQARLVWDVGDLTNPVENDPFTIPSIVGGPAYTFYLADLGTVRLDEVPTGTHRWQGVVQAKGAGSGGQEITVDKLWLEPLDEGWTLLRAPIDASPGLVDYDARDPFSQTAGNLTGKTLPVGGTWTAFGGDATDFTLDTSGHRAQRTDSAGDGALPNLSVAGRAITAGTTSYTTVAAEVDIEPDADGGTGQAVWQAGLLLRAAATTDYAIVRVNREGNSIQNDVRVVFEKVEASSSTTLEDETFTELRIYEESPVRLRVTVDAAGRYAIWVGSPEASVLGDPVIVGIHSSFATGGALASGKVGIMEGSTAAPQPVVYLDNYAAWVPAGDAVLFADQSAELRWDGHFREDSAGAAYGPISYPEGDLLRIPPSGLEGRTVEFFVKGSRGDFDTLPDSSAADDISGQAFYRPSWLFLPS